MQGLIKKEMGAVITAEQQVYYLHSSIDKESLTHNEWIEFTIDEDNKACVHTNDVQEEITEELLLEEEE
jgi:hypothetical protein